MTCLGNGIGETVMDPSKHQHALKVLHKHRQELESIVKPTKTMSKMCVMFGTPKSKRQKIKLIIDAIN